MAVAYDKVRRGTRSFPALGCVDVFPFVLYCAELDEERDVCICCGICVCVCVCVIIFTSVRLKGVILGADSRTTTGSYIANRVSDKITPISDKVYCCRSGSAADTQAISDIVRYVLLIPYLLSIAQRRNKQNTRG